MERQCSLIRRLTVVRCEFSLNWFTGATMSIKIPTNFFRDIDKQFQKCICKNEGTRKVKAILKKRMCLEES